MIKEIRYGQSNKIGIGHIINHIVNIRTEDIVKTSVLAAIGAMISYSVSVVLKFLIKKCKKHQ